MKKMVKACSEPIQADSLNTKITTTSKIRIGGKNFRVHTTEYNDAPDADAIQLYNDFCASISMIAPYDDADYFWATLTRGTIKYIRGGKVKEVDYYMNADDMDIENNEWANEIIEQVCIRLNYLNKDIEPRIIHN